MTTQKTEYSAAFFNSTKTNGEIEKEYDQKLAGWIGNPIGWFEKWTIKRYW